MISFGDPGERDSRVVTERDGRRSGAGDAVGFATPGPGLLYCLSGGGLLHAADLRFYFFLNFFYEASFMQRISGFIFF